MPKKGGKRTKTRTHKIGPPKGATTLSEDAVVDVNENVPKSIVAKGSKVGTHVGELVMDIRRLMEPYTANKLREKSYNRMKDYSSVAGQLGVSHLLVVSQTKSHVILRIARFPDGPTLHFRIVKYSLSRNVRALQRRPFESSAAHKTPPLVVLNNFGQSDSSQVRLMRTTFQHMFPTINVKTVRLSECRRVVLYHYNKEDETVEMRHYAIRANPVGISRSIKKVLQSKIPDLSALEDISQFVEGNAGLGALSDSEAEDDNSKVTLPERFVGKGNGKTQLSAMKLTELGPRITLEIFKVEQGINEGEVLYHKFVQKSPEEVARLKAKIEQMKLLKEQRKNTQEENVKRKRETQEQKLKEKSERKRLKIEKVENEDHSMSDEDDDKDKDEDDQPDSDDEVEENPDYDQEYDNEEDIDDN
eukprot:gene8146-11026_t